MSHFAVVIPAFNEQETIRSVAEGVRQYCPLVIVVDDGSTDGTVDRLRGLDITVLRNETNKGKAAALWRGIEEALKKDVEFVVTLDADGQHLPEDLPRFISKWNECRDQIIIGSRLAEKSAIPAKRYYANRIANFWISWAVGYPVADSQSGYRLYPSSLLRQITVKQAHAYGFVFESEILIDASKLGYSSIAIPISAIYKSHARPSHFRPVLDIVRITMMVAWSLISRGMYLPGLYRAYLRPLFSHARFDLIGGDGVLTLILSNIIILATLGISLAWHLVRVARTAFIADCDAKGPSTIMVLGARLESGGIRDEYRARLERAYQLYKKTNGGTVLILGGLTGGNRLSEAEVGKHYLLGRGLPDDKIIIEDRSRHTLENLRYARELLQNHGDSPLVLVTSRYHLARALAFAKGLEMSVLPCAAEAKQVTGWIGALKLLREAYYLHWYSVGRYWSMITRNQKSLNRIS